MERALRKILINYPKRQMGNKMYGGESSHLPLKINQAGVIPAIFASALLLLPVTFSNFNNPLSSSYDTTLPVKPEVAPVTVSVVPKTPDTPVTILLFINSIEGGDGGCSYLIPCSIVAISTILPI
mgnify:CR=1 FL=1